MAAEIEIISTLDNTDTINGLVETEQAVVSAAGSLTALKKEQQELNKAFADADPNSPEYEQLRQSLLKVNKEIKVVTDSLVELEEEVTPLAGSLASLRANQERLQEAFEQADPKSKEYRKLKSELIGVTKEIKNTELSIEALDTDQVASEIGGLVGGFSDIAVGAVQAFGISEESAEEFLMVFGQIEGAGRIVKGAIEGVQAATKLYNSSSKLATVVTTAQTVSTNALAASQKAYTIAVGTSSGALKAFRVALLATGIGAIIVGVGLLIANFSKVTKFIGNVIEGFESLGPAMQIILAPLFLIIDLFEFLFGATSDLSQEEEKLAEQRREQATEFGRQTQERIDEIKSVRAAEKKAFEANQRSLSLEIDALEAVGKSSFALRKQKLEAIIEDEETTLAATSNMIKRWTDFYTTLAALSGKSTEDFKADLKKQGTDLDDLLEQVEQAQQGQRDRIFAAETNLIKLEFDNNEKPRADSKQTADEKAKDEEDSARRREAALKALADLEVEAIEDEQQRRSAALQLAFERRVATLDSTIKEENDLRKALEEKLIQDLLDLNNDFFSKELQQEFDQSQQLDQLRLQLLEGRKVAEAEQQALDLEVEALRFQEELQNIRFQQEQKQISKEEADLLIEIADQDHQNKLTEINAVGNEDRTAKNLESANKSIEVAMFFANSIGQINDLINQIQDNQLREGEELSLQAQKKRFQREKAFGIVMALINGAAAATQAIAQFGPPPSPLGIAGLAAATTITALSVAAIASKKFNPTGGGGGGGGTATAGFSSALGGAGAGTPPANIPLTDTGAGATGTDAEGGTGGGGGQPTQTVIKAFVVGNELTTAQEAEILIEELSTN